MQSDEAIQHLPLEQFHTLVIETCVLIYTKWDGTENGFIWKFDISTYNFKCLIIYMDAEPCYMNFFRFKNNKYRFLLISFWYWFLNYMFHHLISATLVVTLYRICINNKIKTDVKQTYQSIENCLAFSFLFFSINMSLYQLQLQLYHNRNCRHEWVVFFTLIVIVVIFHS